MNPSRWAALVLGVLAAGACASNRVVQALDEESREFLSTARFLISKDERQAFLALPDEPGRRLWIEDFWKKRDPKPETPDNEFKIEYLRRIDEANRIFREGSTPGWLGDRGHLYITLGPPDTRETYPRGVSFYGVPTEVWYYNFFPIVFIDDSWTGNYRLTPQSAAQVGEINRTQVLLQPPRLSADLAAESLALEISKVRDGEALVRVRLPYKNIWLKADGDRFLATLELEAEAADASGKTVWREKKSLPIALGKEEYLEALRGDFTAEITVRLTPGEYELKVSLVNAAGEGRAAVKKEKLSL